MFEIKTLKDGLKKIAPRTKTSAITDNNNKSLDTILGEKANSTDVPSKMSQLANDTGFITNAALANYPNNTQMNAAINAHHDSTKQDKLAAQTPYTGAGSKSKIPKITTNELGQVTNVEEVAIEAQSANLSQNLTYVNDNNTEIVTDVVLDSVIDDGTATGSLMTFSKVNDGGIITMDFSIFKFLNSDFLVDASSIVSLNPTKFANYLLKSDAPGYADILTKTLASTTYINKANAPGYDDILTNANAKTTYVAKNDAPGYADILTKTDAGLFYVTKVLANSTYETIANVATKMAEVLRLDGSQMNKNPVDDLNNFYTGVGFFQNNTANGPTNTENYMVICASATFAHTMTVQLAVTNAKREVFIRSFFNNAWTEWTNLVVDDLTSTDTNKALSAKQGKALNEKITAETNRATNKENELNTKIDTSTLLLNGSQINFNPVDDLNNFKTGIGYFSDTIQNTPPSTLTNMADATFLVISAANSSDAGVQRMQVAINVVIGLILQRAFIDGSWSNWSIYHNIANNLTTDNQWNVLSAKQGKVLNDTKQDKLVSGTNIKTINSESLLGSGNIELATKVYVDSQIRSAINDSY